MLLLSRRAGESIQIADQITVTVVRVSGNRVKIGIAAPDDVRILRGELADNVTIWMDGPEHPQIEWDTEVDQQPCVTV